MIINFMISSVISSVFMCTAIRKKRLSDISDFTKKHNYLSIYPAVAITSSLYTSSRIEVSPRQTSLKSVTQFGRESVTD